MALGREWQSTFDLKPFNQGDADSFLEQLGDIGTYENETAPDLLDYANQISNPKNARPGPDTLPDQAWAATKLCGARTLLGVDKQLRSDARPPDKDLKDFNSSCMVRVASNVLVDTWTYAHLASNLLIDV